MLTLFWMTLLRADKFGEGTVGHGAVPSPSSYKKGGERCLLCAGQRSSTAKGNGFLMSVRIIIHRLKRRKSRSISRIKGEVVLEVVSPDGTVKDSRKIENIVTDAGDQYYAKKAIVGIAPASPAAPTAATGMKLGTGVTAASKAGAGAALGTYISGSNVAFDTSYPSAADLGSGLGWEITYRTTFPAGTATNSAITEAVLVNDSSTNATSTAANTYARITFSALNKDVDDSLVLTWRHAFLGA